MALLDVILGYDCNLACDYCTITPEMRRRALSTRRVLDALKSAVAEGFDRVSFTGGEPTIRTDLLGLVRAARQVGYRDIKVQSNGLLFAHRPNLERLVEAGATTFHVSIHTHLREPYEALVRRAGTYDAMVAGLGHVAAAGLDPVADVILKADTLPRLPDAIRWLEARGVRRADLWLVSLTDGNRDAIASLPRMTRVAEVMAEAFDVGDALGVTLRSLHLPRCLLGAYADRAHDPAAERVRVLTPDDLFDLEGSKLTPQVHVPACEGCADRARCRGVRPDYLEVYGDAEIAAARGAPSSVQPTRLEVLP
ncbi:MAG: radical SAM protein [Sandaracinaceae bacterium]